MNDLPDDEVSPGLRRIIGDALAAAGGWLGFDAFMARALYAPGLGYYARDSLKFGSLPYRREGGRMLAGSDFVTACTCFGVMVCIFSNMGSISRHEKPAISIPPISIA